VVQGATKRRCRTAFAGALASVGLLAAALASPASRLAPAAMAAAQLTGVFALALFALEVALREEP